MAKRLTLSDAGREALGEMFGNPSYYKEIEYCINTHARKNKDYSSADVGQGLYNFIWAAAYANVSPRTVFSVIRGIKDARIRNLIATGAKPENEALADSKRDDIVYALLELAFEDTFPSLIDQVLHLEVPVLFPELQTA